MKTADELTEKFQKLRDKFTAEFNEGNCGAFEDALSELTDAAYIVGKAQLEKKLLQHLNKLKGAEMTVSSNG